MHSIGWLVCGLAIGTVLEETVRELPHERPACSRRVGHIVTTRMPISAMGGEEPGMNPVVPGPDASDAEWRRFMCGDAPPSALPEPTDADIQQRIPPQRMSVAIHPGSAPPYAREAFQRAAQTAIRAWNHSLQGAVELVEHTGSAPPDVRVRAIDRLVAGGNLGVTHHAPSRRLGRELANLADIEVAWAQRDGPGAVCVAPRELYVLLGHELGHCFWLGESTDLDSIMGPGDWTQAAPLGPFLPERRVILRWRLKAHEALAAVCREAGAERHAADAVARAAELHSAARAPDPRPLPADDWLSDYSYAPPPVRRYWQGSTQVAEGRLRSALNHFTQALAEGLRQPEVHFRRAWVRSWLEDPGGVEELAQAVEMDPTWLYARQCLVVALRDRGSAVEADRQGRVARRLEWIDRIETRLFTATGAWSRPAYAACFRTVARCAARCATLRLRPHSLRGAKCGDQAARG